MHFNADSVVSSGCVAPRVHIAVIVNAGTTEQSTLLDVNSISALSALDGAQPDHEVKALRLIDRLSE
jgi:hypothetical protein